jgi:tetratricopeptide (TPR) repeat protein
MKRILLFITGSFLLLSVAAQTTSKATLYYRKGLELRDKNMFFEASAAFYSAITLDKNYDSAYLELAKLYTSRGMYDTAIANYKQAIHSNPKMTIAHIGLGNLYRDLKPNLDSALICYFNALAVDSLNKITLYSIAWCYNAKGESEKAITFAARSLEVDNNYRPAYGELGHAYRKTKNYQAAIEQFRKNITISPTIDLPYFYSGMCFIELNQKDDALKMYDELNKINPKMAGSLKKRIDAMK